MHWDENMLGTEADPEVSHRYYYLPLQSESYSFCLFAWSQSPCFQFYSLSSVQIPGWSIVWPKLLIQRGRYCGPCPPRPHRTIEFKAKRGNGWFQPNVLSMTMKIATFIEYVLASSFSLRTLPTSPHFNLVTLTLLYWWGDESTERLVIFPRTV